MDDAPDTIPAPQPVNYLEDPLPDLAAWTQYFLNAEIPVLAKTAQALEELRENEDRVDAGMLANLTEPDPFMTLKVMIFASKMRRQRENPAPETILSSLVMIGVSPFFRAFGLQPTVEQWLSQQPLALQGVYALIKRAHRAAHFATAFAIHREDTDVSVIREAAFLHDFAELLMWCHAPTMEIEITGMQRSNPTLRSASLQRFIFHIDLNDLRQALMQQWQLPELLVRISDHRHASHSIVRNVVLAVRLARHTEHGWDNAALPDDFEEISQLLNVTVRATRGFVYKIDQTGQ